jgi:hypothetical protein
MHYHAEVGVASGKTWNFGTCAKIHTNANHALIWKYPVAISGVEGYVPGVNVEVYEDFGCILWEGK